MKRRSILQMMGVAPAAAVVKPAVVAKEAASGSAVWRTAVSIGGNVEQYFDEWGYPIESYEKELAQRKNRLKAFQNARLLGYPMDDDGPQNYECPCIASRRATSPAIKALLQAEYRLRRREYAMDTSVRRFEMMKLVPQWMRGFIRI